MKIYKENKNWVIDGERDFTICHYREAYITIGNDVEHFHIINHDMAMLGGTSKLKILWMAIKFIFTN